MQLSVIFYTFSPMGKEQQLHSEAGNVPSLRDYWLAPPPLPVSSLRRKDAGMETTPSLWEQAAMGEAASPRLFEARRVLHADMESQPLQPLREQLIWCGAATLSTPELLSLVMRTHEAMDDVVPQVEGLLQHYSVQELQQAEFGQLQAVLGEPRAAQLSALLEVSRRFTLPSPHERYVILTPADAANLVRPDMEPLDHEEVRVLVMDAKNHVLANLPLYQGTVNSSVLRPAEIFRLAVSRKSPGIIVCHNHPSGDPTPSPEDIQITEQLVKAGQALDTTLVDHLIIGKYGRFVSLKEQLKW